MKKILLSLFSLALIVTVNPIVFADESPTNSVITETNTSLEQTDTTQDGSAESSASTTETVEEAGITPDQFVYPLERMLESIQLTFTFAEDGKAELLVQFANERLAEAQIMTEKDKQDLAVKVMKLYTKTITEANERLEKAVGEDLQVKNIVEKVELAESNADQVAIKVTGIVSEDIAQELTENISMLVKKTIAVKALAEAKQNFFDAKKEFEEAKEVYKQAKKSGDENAIKEALEKMQQAEEKKDQLEKIKKEIEEVKKQIKEDLEKAKDDDEKERYKEDKDGDKEERKQEEKQLKEAYKTQSKELKQQEKMLKEALKEQQEKLKEAYKTQKEELKKQENKSKESLKKKDHDDEDKDKKDDHDEDEHEDKDHDDDHDED